MNQKGAAPLALLIFAVGLLAFLFISNTVNFQDQLFSTLFPKSKSFAAQDSVKTLTLKLIELNSEYLQTSDQVKKQQLSSEIVAMAAQRKTLLDTLITQNPKEVLKIAIPGQMLYSFPKAAQSLLEQPSTIFGTFEKISENQVIKTTKGEIFTLFPLSSLSQLSPGNSVIIKGLRLDHKIIVDTSDIQIVSPKNFAFVSTIEDSFNSNNCIKAAPTLSINPAGQWGHPGQSLYYQVSIKNNDSPSCPPTKFNPTASLSSNYLTAIPNNFEKVISAGTTESVTIEVLIANNAESGFFDFTQTLPNFLHLTETAQVNIASF